jgi:hypothetical protein
MVEKFLCVCRKRGLRTQELHFLIIGLHYDRHSRGWLQVRRFPCSAAAALFNAAHAEPERPCLDTGSR